jgi:hypothetical protein
MRGFLRILIDFKRSSLFGFHIFQSKFQTWFRSYCFINLIGRRFFIEVNYDKLSHKKMRAFLKFIYASAYGVSFMIIYRQLMHFCRAVYNIYFSNSSRVVCIMRNYTWKGVLYRSHVCGKSRSLAKQYVSKEVKAGFSSYACHYNILMYATRKAYIAAHIYWQRKSLCNI